MDIVTYALCKKLAAAAVSGISNLSVNGTDLIIETNDGNQITMSFPTPKDGVSVTKLEINEDNRLICTLSDGTEIDAGEVKQGKDGTDGEDGISITKVEIINKKLICTMSDGSTIDAGELPGAEAKGLIRYNTYNDLPYPGEAEALYITLDTENVYYYDSNTNMYKPVITNGVKDENLTSVEEKIQTIEFDGMTQTFNLDVTDK